MAEGRQPAAQFPAVNPAAPQSTNQRRIRDVQGEISVHDVFAAIGEQKERATPDKGGLIFRPSDGATLTLRLIVANERDSVKTQPTVVTT